MKNHPRLFKILYVDPNADEKSSSAMLERITESLPFVCVFTVVPSAFVALECTEHTEFGLIVCTCTLSDFSGEDFLRVLDNVGCATPVVLLAARDDESVVLKEHTRGCRLFLSLLRTPFAVPELCELVCAAVAASRARPLSVTPVGAPVPAPSAALARSSAGCCAGVPVAMCASPPPRLHCEPVPMRAAVFPRVVATAEMPPPPSPHTAFSSQTTQRSLQPAAPPRHFNNDMRSEQSENAAVNPQIAKLLRLKHCISIYQDEVLQKFREMQCTPALRTDPQPSYAQPRSAAVSVSLAQLMQTLHSAATGAPQGTSALQHTEALKYAAYSGKRCATDADL